MGSRRRDVGMLNLGILTVLMSGVCVYGAIYSTAGRFWFILLAGLSAYLGLIAGAMGIVYYIKDGRND